VRSDNLADDYDKLPQERLRPWHVSDGYLKRIKGTAEEASGLRSDPALGFDAAGGAEDLFATKVDHNVILVPQVVGAAIGAPAAAVAAFVFH
jgi:hypothetical protein